MRGRKRRRRDEEEEEFRCSMSCYSLIKYQHVHLGSEPIEKLILCCLHSQSMNVG